MKKIFFAFIIIFSVGTLSAQVDRSIAPSQYKNSRTNKKVDVVESSLDFLKEKLNLDGFQTAIARNLIADNQDKSKQIIESTTYSDIEKRNLIIKLADEFSLEIKKSLSAEQLKKYEKLIAKNR